MKIWRVEFTDGHYVLVSDEAGTYDNFAQAARQCIAWNETYSHHAVETMTRAEFEQRRTAWVASLDSRDKVANAMLSILGGHRV